MLDILLSKYLYWERTVDFIVTYCHLVVSWISNHHRRDIVRATGWKERRTNAAPKNEKKKKKKKKEEKVIYIKVAYLGRRLEHGRVDPFDHQFSVAVQRRVLQGLDDGEVRIREPIIFPYHRDLHLFGQPIPFIRKTLEIPEVDYLAGLQVEGTKNDFVGALVLHHTRDVPDVTCRMESQNIRWRYLHMAQSVKVEELGDSVENTTYYIHPPQRLYHRSSLPSRPVPSHPSSGWVIW